MSTCATETMPPQLTYDLKKLIALTTLLKAYSKFTVGTLWRLIHFIACTRRARKLVTSFLEKKCLYSADSQPATCLKDLYQMIDQYRDQLLSLGNLYLPRTTHWIWQKWWESELEWWDDVAETCYLGIHGKQLSPLLDELASKL